MPMNAIPKPAADLLQQTGQLSESVTRPIPGSRKIFVEGSRPDLRVAMREIAQTQTPTLFGGETNPPITVYDPSGPYTDPDARIDLSVGLPALRAKWIEERGDTELLPQLSSAFGRGREHDPKLAGVRFPNRTLPRVAKAGANVSQMHYARKGIVTPEMEYVAIRENQRLDAVRDALLLKQHPGESFGASIQKFITPEFVRDEIARGRAIIPNNINHPESEPMIIGRNFLTKINANIGNSACRPASPRKSKAGVVDPLGRRHGDGPVHRQAHPRNPRVDHPQLAGADRHRADLPGAGEGRRPRRGPHLGDLPRHADRAGRAGRGLLHHPRRRAAAHVPLTAKRVTGIVSRGGSIMAKWCLAHHKENFLYTHFEDAARS
jgi:phosphomethylpyrimidine synthase